jgi:hypothetical protein
MKYVKKRNKVFVTAAGDKRAGIPAATITIDLGNCESLAEVGEAREKTRASLQLAFNDILDEPTGVRFEDECPDCGQQGCDGSCHDNSPEGRVLRALSKPPPTKGLARIAKLAGLSEGETFTVLQAMLRAKYKKVIVVGGNRYRRRMTNRHDN